MASPHVAGLAAYLISKFDLSSPAEVEDKMKCLCTKGAISGIHDLQMQNTSNVLIFNGANENDICVSASSTTIVATDSTTVPPNAANVKYNHIKTLFSVMAMVLILINIY